MPKYSIHSPFPFQEQASLKTVPTGAAPKSEASTVHQRALFASLATLYSYAAAIYVINKINEVGRGHDVQHSSFLLLILKMLKKRARCGGGE